jgi:hypothetical protein
MLLWGVVLTTNSYSQNYDGIISIETDPVTTAFGARTISMLLEPEKIEHWSVFINVVSADFPNWMDDILNPNNKNKGFQTSIKIGGGLSVDYFFNNDRHGWYTGVMNLIFVNEIVDGEQEVEVVTHNIIPRVGYRKFIWEDKGWYVNPFFGLRYEHDFSKNSKLNSSEFKPAGIQPFGTVHIGYHF